MSKIYIAGPMTGLPQFNFPAFRTAARLIGCAGETPINPAEMCSAAGFREWMYPTGDPVAAWKDGFNLRAAARRDLLVLTECDAIYMLPGWEDSAGARAEKAVADWLGLAEFKLDGEGAE
jgi:hypothetical protein